MKAANYIRVIVVIMLTAWISPLVYGQIRSDEKNGCYTDNTLHFHWYLPMELKWKFMPGIEPHTVFRAVAKCGITVTVSVREIDGAEDGITPDGLARFLDVDTQRDITEMVLNKQKQHDGTIGKIIDVTKCRFAGKDAIKAITLHKYKDDVRSVNYYVQSYRAIHDGCTWQMTIKCTDELWKLLGESGRKELFQGFGFNTKPESTLQHKPKQSLKSGKSATSKQKQKSATWDSTTRCFTDNTRKLKWDLSEGYNWTVLPETQLPHSMLFCAVDNDGSHSVMLMAIANDQIGTTIWNYSDEWKNSILQPLVMGFDDGSDVVYEEPVFKRVKFKERQALKCQLKPVLAELYLTDDDITKSMEVIAFCLGKEIILVSTIVQGTLSEVMDNTNLVKYSKKLGILEE